MSVNLLFIQGSKNNFNMFALAPRGIAQKVHITQ